MCHRIRKWWFWHQIRTRIPIMEVVYLRKQTHGRYARMYSTDWPFLSCCAILVNERILGTWWCCMYPCIVRTVRSTLYVHCTVRKTKSGWVSCDFLHCQLSLSYDPNLTHLILFVLKWCIPYTLACTSFSTLLVWTYSTVLRKSCLYVLCLPIRTWLMMNHLTVLRNIHTSIHPSNTCVTHNLQPWQMSRRQPKFTQLW